MRIHTQPDLGKQTTPETGMGFPELPLVLLGLSVDQWVEFWSVLFSFCFR